MKYPRAEDPFDGSHTEFLAWMFGQLAATYSMIAQYERDDKRREHDHLIDVLSTKKDQQA